jgi:hypothetical protein
LVSAAILWACRFVSVAADGHFMRCRYPSAPCVPVQTPATRWGDCVALWTMRIDCLQANVVLSFDHYGMSRVYERPLHMDFRWIPLQ